MDSILIGLYFEQYHWPAKKIAEFIGKPESYIRQVIQEEGFTQPAIMECNDHGEVVHIDKDVDKVQVLKDAEVAKQALLQPAYVKAEALLLAKIISALEDPFVHQRVDAHEVFRAHAATLQSLKQHAVVNKVLEDKATGTGININVIGSIQ